MKVPDSGRRRALIIVDVQKAFVQPRYRKRNTPVLASIRRLINGMEYDLYVEAMFHAEQGSLWDKQTHWTAPKDRKHFPVVRELQEALAGKKVIRIVKGTKSTFGGKPKLLPILGKHRIKEVHVIGYDTYDCVLATANDAFDRGFFSYVIEECTETCGPARLTKSGLEILRENSMTNHSVSEKIAMKLVRQTCVSRMP